MPLVPRLPDLVKSIPLAQYQQRSRCAGHSWQKRQRLVTPGDGTRYPEGFYEPKWQDDAKGVPSGCWQCYAIQDGYRERQSVVIGDKQEPTLEQQLTKLLQAHGLRMVEDRAGDRIIRRMIIPLSQSSIPPISSPYLIEIAKQVDKSGHLKSDLKLG